MAGMEVVVEVNMVVVMVVVMAVMTENKKDGG